jgi:hypothetical protein
MGFIELVVTVCAISQPNLCEDKHFQLDFDGSPAQCAQQAQPYIAEWIGEHPKWLVSRWRCNYPDRLERRV